MYEIFVIRVRNVMELRLVTLEWSFPWCCRHRFRRWPQLCAGEGWSLMCPVLCVLLLSWVQSWGGDNIYGWRNITENLCTCGKILRKFVRSL